METLWHAGYLLRGWIIWSGSTRRLSHLTYLRVDTLYLNQPDHSALAAVRVLFCLSWMSKGCAFLNLFDHLLVLHDIQRVQVSRFVTICSICLHHAKQTSIIHTVGKLAWCVIWHFELFCHAITIYFIVVVKASLIQERRRTSFEQSTRSIQRI